MTPRERQRVEDALTRTLAHATPTTTIPKSAIIARVATIVSTDAEPLAASCALCGQPMDPQPGSPICDGMSPTVADDDLATCSDCYVETTAATETRRAIVTSATEAILGDLGRRLAARCALVECIAGHAPRDHEHAAATFAAAFSSAYDAHLYDLTTGRQRDAEQLASDVLVALDATSRGH